MKDKTSRQIKKEQRALEIAEREKKFRRAKKWQILLFPTIGTAHNAFMFLMMLVSFYAAGIVGLGTVVASMVLTGTRIFDGITDPIVAVIADKTEGKHGKVRPLIIMAYLIMSAAVLILFFTTHKVPEGMRLIYFIAVYCIYIIGYTISSIVGPIGKTIITTDPEQRPVLGGTEAIYNSVYFALASVYLSKYLAPKHGGYNNETFFHELTITTIIIAGIFYVISFIAIRESDRIENFGVGANKQHKVSIKNMWKVLKGNRPLQVFILAATTDKLSMQAAGNQVVPILLFGIIIGNYWMFGTMQTIALVPNILLLLIGMRYAKKFGTKQAYVAATWACIVIYTSWFFLLWLGDPTQIDLNNIGFMTIAFITLHLLGGGARMISTGLVQPMLPDITDYETHKSGKFVPGTISATYSFIDKMVSSFSQTIVGLTLSFIGFKAAFPDINTPYSNNIFWATMFLDYGILMFAWIASLIAMKFYPLTKERMEEIQADLDIRRKENDLSNLEDEVVDRLS